MSDWPKGYIPTKQEALRWAREEHKQKLIKNMSTLTHSGTIVVLNETEVISDKFSKRSFVINDNTDYPQEVQFEFHKDKCDHLNSFRVGDDVQVSFNLNGRSWTNPKGETKYFNTLQAWKIEYLNPKVNESFENDISDLPNG